MAERLSRELLLKLTSDTAGATKAERAMERVRGTSERVAAAQVRMATGTHKLSNEFGGLNGNMSRFATQLDRVSPRLSRIATTFGGMIGKVGQLNAAVAALGATWAARQGAAVYRSGMATNANLETSMQRMAAEIRQDRESLRSALVRSQKETQWALQYQRESRVYKLDEVQHTLSDMAVLYRGDMAKAREATRLAGVLAAKNPHQGLEGAKIAIQEAESGVWTSAQRRFFLPKNILEQNKDKGGLGALQATLKSMRVDDGLVRAMGNTAPGMQNQISSLYEQVWAKATKGAYAARREHLSFVRERLEGLTTEKGALTKIGGAVSEIGGKMSKLYYQALEFPIRNAEKILKFLKNLKTGLDPTIALLKSFGKAFYGGFMLPIKGFIFQLKQMTGTAGFLGNTLSKLMGTGAKGLTSPLYLLQPLAKMLGTGAGAKLSAGLMHRFGVPMFLTPGSAVRGVRRGLKHGVPAVKDWIRNSGVPMDPSHGMLHFGGGPGPVGGPDGMSDGEFNAAANRARRQNRNRQQTAENLNEEFDASGNKILEFMKHFGLIGQLATKGGFLGQIAGQSLPEILESQFINKLGFFDDLATAGANLTGAFGEVVQGMQGLLNPMNALGAAVGAVIAPFVILAKVARTITAPLNTGPGKMVARGAGKVIAPALWPIMFAMGAGGGVNMIRQLTGMVHEGPQAFGKGWSQRVMMSFLRGTDFERGSRGSVGTERLGGGLGWLSNQFGRVGGAVGAGAPLSIFGRTLDTSRLGRAGGIGGKLLGGIGAFLGRGASGGRVVMDPATGQPVMTPFGALDEGIGMATSMFDAVQSRVPWLHNRAIGAGRRMLDSKMRSYAMQTNQMKMKYMNPNHGLGAHAHRQLGEEIKQREINYNRIAATLQGATPEQMGTARGLRSLNILASQHLGVKSGEETLQDTLERLFKETPGWFNTLPVWHKEAPAWLIGMGSIFGPGGPMGGGGGGGGPRGGGGGHGGPPSGNGGSNIPWSARRERPSTQNRPPDHMRSGILPPGGIPRRRNGGGNGGAGGGGGTPVDIAAGLQAIFGQQDHGRPSVDIGAGLRDIFGPPNRGGGGSPDMGGGRRSSPFDIGGAMGGFGGYNILGALMGSSVMSKARALPRFARMKGKQLLSTAASNSGLLRDGKLSIRGADFKRFAADMGSGIKTLGQALGSSAIALGGQAAHNAIGVLGQLGGVASGLPGAAAGKAGALLSGGLGIARSVGTKALGGVMGLGGTLASLMPTLWPTLLAGGAVSTIVALTKMVGRRVGAFTGGFSLKGGIQSARNAYKSAGQTVTGWGRRIGGGVGSVLGGGVGALLLRRLGPLGMLIGGLGGYYAGGKAGSGIGGLLGSQIVPGLAWAGGGLAAKFLGGKLLGTRFDRIGKLLIGGANLANKLDPIRYAGRLMMKTSWGRQVGALGTAAKDGIFAAGRGLPNWLGQVARSRNGTVPGWLAQQALQLPRMGMDLFGRGRGLAGQAGGVAANNPFIRQLLTATARPADNIAARWAAFMAPRAPGSLVQTGWNILRGGGRLLGGLGKLGVSGVKGLGRGALGAGRWMLTTRPGRIVGGALAAAGLANWFSKAGASKVETPRAPGTPERAEAQAEKKGSLWGMAGLGATLATPFLAARGVFGRLDGLAGKKGLLGGLGKGVRGLGKLFGVDAGTAAAMGGKVALKRGVGSLPLIGSAIMAGWGGWDAGRWLGERKIGGKTVDSRIQGWMYRNLFGGKKLDEQNAQSEAALAQVRAGKKGMVDAIKREGQRGATEVENTGLTTTQSIWQRFSEGLKGFWEKVKNGVSGFFGGVFGGGASGGGGAAPSSSGSVPAPNKKPQPLPSSGGSSDFGVTKPAAVPAASGGNVQAPKTPAATSPFGVSAPAGASAPSPFGVSVPSTSASDIFGHLTQTPKVTPPNVPTVTAQAPVSPNVNVSVNAPQGATPEQVADAAAAAVKREIPRALRSSSARRELLT